MAIFKVLSKVIGAVITIFSALALGSLIIGFFALLFSTELNRTPWFQYADMANYTDVPMWVLAILGLFAIGIPFFFLFLLGLRILVDNLRTVGSVARYTLLAIWIFCIAVAIFLGVRQASQTGYDGKDIKKEQLPITVNDTLKIKFRYNDFFAKSIGQDTSYRIAQDSSKAEVLYSNNIELYIMKTDQSVPYVQIERIANGSSSSEAGDIAEKIKYSFELQGNTLILDNYLTTDIANKFRNQRVEVYLYLPEGIVFRPDSSVQEYDNTDNDFFDLWFDGEFTYRMEKDKVKCLDCKISEGDESNTEDEHNDGGNVHISGDNGDVNVNVDDVDVKVNVDNDKIHIKTTSKKH